MGRRVRVGGNEGQGEWGIDFVGRELSHRREADKSSPRLGRPACRPPPPPARSSLTRLSLALATPARLGFLVPQTHDDIVSCCSIGESVCSSTHVCSRLGCSSRAHRATPLAGWNTARGLAHTSCQATARCDGRIGVRDSCPRRHDRLRARVRRPQRRAGAPRSAFSVQPFSHRRSHSRTRSLKFKRTSLSEPFPLTFPSRHHHVLPLPLLLPLRPLPHPPLDPFLQPPPPRRLDPLHNTHRSPLPHGHVLRPRRIEQPVRPQAHAALQGRLDRGPARERGRAGGRGAAEVPGKARARVRSARQEPGRRREGEAGALTSRGMACRAG